MSEMENNVKKAQHYVPQFYQKFFSSNQKSIGTYRFRERKLILDTSIQNSMYKNYFYGEDCKIENKLAEFEGRWCSILRQIVETCTLPTSEEEIIHIKAFVLITSTRTNLRGKEYVEFIAESIKNFTQNYKPEIYNAFISDKVTIHSKPPASVTLNLSNILLLYLMDLKVDLIINKSNIDFISSDNPTVICNQLYEAKRLNRGFGIGENGIQFIVPLSPRLAICIYDDNVYKLLSTSIKSGSIIKKINELLLDNADELIFYKTETDESKNKKITSYINSLVQKKIFKKETTGIQTEYLHLRHKQIFSHYDLSNVFQIDPVFLRFKIKDHSKSDIETAFKQKYNQLLQGLSGLSDEEVKERIPVISQIGVFINDNQRPWCCYIDELLNNK